MLFVSLAFALLADNLLAGGIFFYACSFCLSGSFDSFRSHPPDVIVPERKLKPHLKTMAASACMTKLRDPREDCQSTIRFMHTNITNERTTLLYQ
jgi:hypothetical protein